MTMPGRAMTRDELDRDRLRYAVAVTEYRLLVATGGSEEEARLRARLLRLAGQLGRAERRAARLTGSMAVVAIG